MASSSSLVQFLFLLFFVSHLPSSFSRPANIMFDLGRDSSTLQYWIKITQGTPQTAMKLVLDLGGKLPWLRCHKGYNSSSIRPVKCTTTLCSLASKPVNSTCLPKKTCSIYTSNPVTKSVGKGELMSDRVAVKSNPDDSEGIPVVSPRRFAFGCTTTSNFLSGLFKGAKGVAGLGRSSALSVVTQFAVGFRLPRIFALELSGGFSNNVYFGGGPYIHPDFSSESNTNRILEYTPLLVNPKSTDEYFVDLKSIQIHGKTVPIDKKLISINKETGVGGTKIDIQTPYTTLETSIYKAVIKVYNEWAKSENITMVAAVAPFTSCYMSSTLPSWLYSGFRISPPSLSFVFPKNQLNVAWWDLFKVNDAVHCVAFVDGGSNPLTSIVIGAAQIGFLEFDISRSRLGFMQPNYMSGF
ncbi:hypothetical protein C5167_039999 [Papaver somniferum]|uniref:Peptidase A1 domain-containing protein n=1 Tax=Papaver somniferum TaxID=3469 RepID=A0A4Y7IDP0_PAPSO|nr:basic 7S globulin-like [Papaver somniferum]RZC47057.1 hypothetical protein C5167_039999 [Papaver somniferum]